MFTANRFNLSPSPSSIGQPYQGSYVGAGASKVRARVCAVAMLGSDMVAFGAATFLAFAIDVVPQSSPYERAIENSRMMGLAWHGWGSMLVVVSLLTYFASRGHYTSRVPTWTQMTDVFVATAVALACDIFLTVAIYQRPLTVEGLLRWVLLAPSLLVLRAITRQALRGFGLWSLRTLIIAVPGEIDTARAALRSDPALGYTVVGTITPEAASVLGDDELVALVAQRGADFVVMSIGAGDRESCRTLLSSLRTSGLPIALLPALEGLPVAGFRQHYFLGHDIVMLVSRNNLARPLSRAMKAAFDQVGAVMLLILFAPLMAVLAVLVRAEGGSAFYRHRRVGAGGRTFDCLKFRSMVPDLERVLQRLIENDPAAAREWAETQKLRDDPRITAVGRFLRRSSLDELPQLLNVVRGEMSLVGPRPIVQAEVKRYGQDIEYYYAAKPGLTGLWQVSGRNDTSYTGRVKLDVWYVRNWSLWHDLAILYRTIPAVFLQRGAH